MGNIGKAISQKGFDVKTCADRFLVGSSAFQTLKIYNTYSVSTTIPAGAPNIITINHALGFIAPFLIMYNGNNRNGTANSYFFSDSYGYPLGGGHFTGASNDVNNLKIYIDSGWDGANAPGGNSEIGDTVYFTVYIFLNDFSSISHTEKNVGTVSGNNSDDYGIRISKEGFDVKTCIDRDCVLSSSFFNQIIDQQGIFTATSSGDQTISISSQGFIPSVLTYTMDVGVDEIYFDTLTIEINKLSTGMNAGDKLYYIIFKQSIG